MTLLHGNVFIIPSLQQQHRMSVKHTSKCSCSKNRFVRIFSCIDALCMLHIKLRASLRNNNWYWIWSQYSFCIWLYHNWKIEIYCISKCLLLGGSAGGCMLLNIIWYKITRTMNLNLCASGGSSEKCFCKLNMYTAHKLHS